MPDSSVRNIDALKIDRSEPEPSGRRPWILILTGLILGLVAALWGYQNRAVSVVSQPVLEDVRSGTTAPDSRSTDRSVTLLNASGYVTARRKATVSAKVTGRIDSVHVEEGMSVAEGDVLAQLDPVNIRRALELGEARLTLARAALDETRVRIRESGRDFDRIRQLTEQRVASDADFDRAEATLLALRARQLQQEADIAVSERLLAVARQDMEDLTIRAPFSGVVVSKDAQPGEMISPVSGGGAFTRTGICTLVDMASLEIEVDVNEAYIPRVHPGQLALATLNAYPDWKIPCRVIAIIPTADRQKATVRVRIGFDNLDPRILPDMGVRVAFQSQESPQGGRPTDSPADAPRRMSVPARALQSTGGRDFVWIVTDGRVSARFLSVEERSDSLAFVPAGLSAGERVVVESSAPLREAQRVRERDTPR
jgi:HlyD family secretion protein